MIRDIALTKSFATRTPWRLRATQGPEFADQDSDRQPGAIYLCLAKHETGPCAVQLPAMAKPLPPLTPADWEPHFLAQTKLVYPHGRASPPLLLVRTESLASGDGDQAVYTQFYAYRRGSDRFVQVYGHMTGHNENQEVRYVASGPLAGSVISAEPTQDAPYTFWITVNKARGSQAYRPVLRYRSATEYGDGNPLAVIDSEMPNIQRRLGLWRAGMPLPLPAHGCEQPRLTHGELWCGPGR